MPNSYEPLPFKEPMTADPLRNRREEIVRRFRLHTFTSNLLREAYTRHGINPTQTIRLHEPDLGVSRGQIQFVSSMKQQAYGHVINLRNSVGRDDYFMSVAFQSYGFTGLIKPAEQDTPLSLNGDQVLDILAPVTEYCEWKAVPENVPHYQFDVSRLLEIARQVRPEDVSL